MEIKRGVALGNAIIAARSAAAFYADIKIRERWLKDFLRDVMSYEEINKVDTGQYQTLSRHFPNWEHALVTFCLGLSPVETFRSVALSSVDLKSNRSSERALQHDDRENPNVGDGERSRACKERWEHAVEHVVNYTNSTYSDTDLKVEFERIYELDASSADGGYQLYDKTLATSESLKTILSFSFLNKAAVFASEAAEPNRIRYKSYMYGSNLLILDNDLSNHEIPDTDGFLYALLHREIQRVLDISAADTESFIYKTVMLTGGSVVNCPRYGGSSNRKKRRGGSNGTSDRAARKKRRMDGNREVRNDGDDDDDYGAFDESESANDVDREMDPKDGRVRFTSFNSMDNSIQFTFNTHNGKYYYTANLSIIPADDHCANDVVLKRRYVSSVCKCIRPTLAWRICVLVTPINTATIVDSDGAHFEVQRVIMSALKSFRSVYEEKISRSKKKTGCRVAVISGFIGLPIAPYLDKITSPKPWRSKSDPNDGVSESLCSIHSWLRAYSASTWTVYSGKNALLRLLHENSGRAVVVRRPIFMSGTDGESVGWRAFVRYMTYEDAIEKVVRLTEHRFYNGFDEAHLTGCGVAYARGPNDLIVFKKANAGSPYPNDDLEMMTREQRRMSYTDGMWHAAGFHAPSRVIIDVEVLTTIGFNPAELAVGYTGGGRTFEHEDPDTGDRCTVFCSTPLRLVTKVAKHRLDDYENEEDRYGVLVEDADGLAKGVFDEDDIEEYNARLVTSGVQVLYNEKPMDSRLDANRTTRNDARARYRETVHDVTAYWAGVYMVSIDFVDPALEHVKFTFFTGTGDGQMTLKNLLDFSDHCTGNDLLPPPIVNTIQSVVLKHRYASQ